jgi:c-di-GMP-binding flagellar brake protein YcgR
LIDEQVCVAMVEGNAVNSPVSTVARRGPPRLSDALDRIAASAEPHEMRDPYDIGEALTMLAQTGEAVTIYPGGRGAPLVARIASVDPELPHFVLDLAGDAVIPTGMATFVASLGGNAKLQFDLTQPWGCVPGESNLVPAVFPDVCKVLNRRAQQRQETPVGLQYVASFVAQGKSYELALYDFSLGGVGLRASPEEARGLHVGRKLEGVRLQLGPALLVTADLEIRLQRPFRTFLLGEQVQIGCRFTNISMLGKQSIDTLVSSSAGHRRPA